MPRSRFGVALIVAAAAALALLAVSLGWISASSGAGKTVTQPAIVPTALTERTLARLPAPAGFTRGSCTLIPSALPNAVCFLRRRAIVPDAAVMTAIVTQFGARLGTSLDRKLGSNAPTPATCHPERIPSIQRVTTPLLVPVFCTVDAAIHSQQLIITLTSVVLDDHGRLTSTSRSRAHLGRGSQVSVTDLGT